MPFTAAYPGMMSGDNDRDIAELWDRFIAFLDEINYALDNINAGTIKGNLKAATIEASQITTNKLRVQSAQIYELIADKISAGTLDLSKGITINGSNGDAEVMYFDSGSMSIYVAGQLRYFVGQDSDTGQFVFLLLNSDGSSGIYMDDNGDAVFTGTVNAAKVVSSIIESYNGAGQKNGLWSNPNNNYADLELWWNGTNILRIYNAVPDLYFVLQGSTGGITLSSNGNITNARGNWDFQYTPTVNGVTVATQNDIAGLQQQINVLSQRITALGG